MEYNETTGSFAHKLHMAQRTIVDYCRLGILEHIRLENGTRLLRSGQEQKARDYFAKRIANRGNRGTPCAA
jgi:hypothetical protein